MTIKKKIFIVAGNLTEFIEYKEKKLHEWTKYSNILDPFPEYVYVSNADQFKGRSEIEGYYIGSYKNRNDIDEIYWCIKSIKARNAIADAQKGSNCISGTSISSGVTGTISNINTAVEQRTKALEKALEELKKQIGSVAS